VDPRRLPGHAHRPLPSRALPPHHRSYPDNLCTLLDGAYQLDVHETSTMLCPRHCSAGPAQSAGRPARAGPWRALRRSCALVAELASPWEREQQPTAQFEQPVVPTTAPPGHAGTAATRPAGFAEFLDWLTPDRPSAATPRLHYLHLLLPHRPWRALPSGLRYPEPTRTLGLATKGASWGEEAAWTRLALERHRLQLVWADRLLGEVLLTTLRPPARTSGHWWSSPPTTASASGRAPTRGHRPRQRPRDRVGAAVRQGAEPAPAPGRRPQLGARRPATHPGRPSAGRAGRQR
jgi:hypothetical protein